MIFKHDSWLTEKMKKMALYDVVDELDWEQVIVDLDFTLSLKNIHSNQMQFMIRQIQFRHYLTLP